MRWSCTRRQCRRWVPWVWLLALGWALAGAQVVAANSAARTLVLVSDQFCPYVCAPDNPIGQGYMVDFAKAALAPAGFEVAFVEQLWPRAVRLMQAGKVDGVLAITAQRARGWLLSPPLGSDSTSIMSVKPLFNGPVQGNNLYLLNGLRIAQSNTELEFASNPLEFYLKQRLAQGDNRIVHVSSANPVGQMVKMLIGGRVDAVIDNPEVLAYTAQMMNRPDLVIAGRFGARPLHIALANSSLGEEVVAALSAALTQWRADGRWQALLASYGLRELPDDSRASL
ncbi:transporter substrate-binding domain-containing protein [Simiduia sp. 21SJ11W-1]|uniref:substrate-binding periplasmic protein n=1 Tax=Simiduia sp. 21SJ11W-1 TaxID=2909669 RepID=UPI00209F35DA|nr:transporter substrate-binding domain-containing protein [Simiduia sp. 21SJ11W-1]UTA47004.1 transporter substrate-binding domain-containing protein [Simiduia sp. 21SJ11W-1]